MRIYELYIPDIVCPACVTPIESALKECKEVKKISVDVIGHTATVETDETDATNDHCVNELRKSVDDKGYPCEEFIETTPVGADQNDKAEAQRLALETKKIVHTKKAIRNYWIKGIVGLLFGTAMIALSIWGAGIPILAMYILGGISSATTLFLGKETYQQAAVKLIKTKTLSMESLFSVSTLLALGVSCASFFVPWLPMMFDAALLILGFKNIGKAVEESAKQRLNQKTFRSYAPEKIMVEKPSKELIEIPVKNLWPGNTIIVYSEQTIPVDGVCLDESTTIYNTIATGKTIPQHITKNSIIYAGSTVPKDVPFIRIKVTDKEADSYLALLDKRSKKAELEKATLEDSTTKILQYFIPVVFGIATVSAIIVASLISPVAAILCAISVLVSACPCALGLVTPLAIKTGIAKAAGLGVSFKSGKSIEAAASDIDTVVFDLNGTLTTGIPKVTKSTVSKEMLGILAKIESTSSHPIAQAIHSFAVESQCELQEFKTFSVDKSYHAGITADIDGDQFVVGNSKIMRKKGINTHHLKNELKNVNAEHIVYFAKNNQIVGYILLEDPLRDDAVETIRELERQGKEIHICTGSDYKTAKKQADKLGISRLNIHANCVGESKDEGAKTKTSCIRELIAQGHRVAMVGDSANDAAAMPASHFGVAVKSASGNKNTQDNADATINQNSLWAIVNAFTIAKQTMANIKQNLAVSVGYNFLAMIAFSGLLLAIGFAVNPALGAALMVAQTVLILMNVERFKRQSTPTIPTSPSPKKEIKPNDWESTNKKLKHRLVNKNQPTIAYVPAGQIQDVQYNTFSPTNRLYRSVKAKQEVKQAEFLRPFVKNI